MHDRLEDYISEETCKAEIGSFLQHGQLVPVLGRRLTSDPDHELELIYGARRLFVARTINVELLVEVRDMSDREAIIAMDIENRHRADISPYERGMSYARWLRTGYFRSQDDVARELGVSASQVSRLLKLARLPSVIIAAFGSALDICEGWGLQIAEQLEDPEKREKTLRVARSITAMSPRPAPKDVYQRLLGAAVAGRKPKKVAHDRVVKSADGRPLFRVRRRRNSIALLLPLEHVSARALERIEALVTEALTAEPRYGHPDLEQPRRHTSVM